MDSPQLPTGTVAFLFTDIEGSAKLAQEYPAEMPSLLAQHHAILHQAIEAHSGFVFQIIGDAFCAAFHTAADALNAGLEAQRHLRDAAWHPAALKVRMGIHTGPAQAGGIAELDGGYQGYLTLTRAQRIMSVAHGGQILVSGTSAELVRGELPADVELRDMGAHRLKGLMNLEHLWQVVAPELPAEFPPIQSLNAMPNNLPIQLTSFIGRQAELAESLRLLSETRLITLAGPGGTGKTRLAIQTAAEALDRASFPDGAWLVELAPVSSPDLVLPATAAVLNVREPRSRPLQAALADFLRSRNLLLILDNCEHLIETCAQAAEAFLQAGPGVKVLASSREPLGIAGEAIFRVPSFHLPAQVSTLEELLQNEAVQLFVERAKAVKPGFALTPQNGAAVNQICRRLDGIPLAIELAAARAALLSPAGIADRLDDRFRLLTGGSRSAMPRQQTLEALIDWSYDLLSQDEKVLFHILSVFASGFTYDAAEAVMGDDILENLAQLVNKSLVLAEEDSVAGNGRQGETRYRMLETIRQYAREKLLAAGQMEAIRDRHLEYFVRFLKESESQMGEANQRRWARLLQNERDNLRGAIEWALERRPAVAIEMIASQGVFWGQRGYAAEVLRWLEDGIEKVAEQPIAEGEDQIPREVTLAQAYWVKAVVIEALGDAAGAVSAIKESVRLWREVGDLRGLARSLSLLGAWGVLFGIPNPYRAYLEEGLAIARKIHFDEAIGTALIGLGVEKMWGGDYATAQAYLEESMELMHKAGDERSANLGQVTLGQVALLQGDFQTARARFVESMTILQDFGNSYFVNIARSGLADVLRLEKDFPQAMKTYVETLAEWQEMGNHGAVARCLECLAFIGGELAQIETHASRQHDLLQRSGVLLGAAEALRETSGSAMTSNERTEYDEKLSTLRSLSPQEVFKAGWRQGREMNIDQAKAIGDGLRAKQQE